MIQKQNYQFTPDNIKIFYNIEQCNSLINECINSNYTQLIIRTIEKQLNKNEIFNYIQEQGPIVEIDLKYYYLKLRECELISPEIKKVYDEIKSKFTDAFINGKTLILNFDDCSDGSYDKLFDPVLLNYTGIMFTPKMWRPQTFKEGDNFLEHTHGNEDIKLKTNFKFVVYTKFLIKDINVNEEQMVNIIERHFRKDFPLEYMKIFVLVEEKKVVVEEKNLRSLWKKNLKKIQKKRVQQNRKRNKI